MGANRIDLKFIRSLYERIAPHITRTPLCPSTTLSTITGRDLHLKLENQQFTSSFKERGALARLQQLNPDERAAGVITMSAGNHAQALARHARRLHIPTTIVMPRTTPVAKIEKTKYFDPDIVLMGSTIDESVAYVNAQAASANLTLIHPYDDAYVIAGQGSLGIEILEQLPEVNTVVVPVGGGGLISGIAIALIEAKPSVRIVGVQSEQYSPIYASFHDRAWSSGRSQISIAEGIAVKTPGRLTLPIIKDLVDDMVVVSESAIETAIFRLLDIEKTLVEGAGAAALAAVQEHPDIAKGKTVCVISGGNADPSILANVIERSLVRHERVVRIFATVQDVPGSLSKLANDIGETDSNIIDIYHRRAFGTSTLDATVVEITLQLRGEDDKPSVIQKLRDLGHKVSDPDLANH